jgi:ATP-dependent RNA helicase RhlE
MTFDRLGLCAPLLRAVEEKGYRQPSPIQAQAIPAILSGRDVMAAAQTGTGKTAGFALPLLQRLSESGPLHPHRTRALVLAPTRELAAQVEESVRLYGAHLPLKSAVVFGGVKINPQIARLRKGADILVATPGRLLDLHQQGAVRFGDLEILVLDEADRMLDMGFIHDIRRILNLLPSRRQNLLFSATCPAEIRDLTGRLLHDPLAVEVAPPNATAERVEQSLFPVDKKRKPALLQELVVDREWQQVLVFTRTKHGANRLAQQLERAGLQAAAIHGNKSQGARTRALSGFREGRIRILVATDIAARGLDIAQLPQVVNFDLPNVPEDYVHRIGRTGRAGAAGRAFSLVSADEIAQLNSIERLIRRHIPREYVGGFEPEHEVPASAPLRAVTPGRARGARPAPAPARAGEGKQRPGRRHRRGSPPRSRVGGGAAASSSS